MSDRVSEWFAAMVKGLAAQGWQRAITLIGGQPHCAYRNEEGHMCPVGMIVPSDAPVIVKNMAKSVKTMSQQRELSDLGLGELQGREYFFLVEAQAAHDGEPQGDVLAVSPEQVRVNFRQLAQVYGTGPLPAELQEE